MKEREGTATPTLVRTVDSVITHRRVGLCVIVRESGRAGCVNTEEVRRQFCDIVIIGHETIGKINNKQDRCSNFWWKLKTVGDT